MGRFEKWILSDSLKLWLEHCELGYMRARFICAFGKVATLRMQLRKVNCVPWEESLSDCCECGAADCVCLASVTRRGRLQWQLSEAGAGGGPNSNCSRFDWG